MDDHLVNDEDRFAPEKVRERFADARARIRAQASSEERRAIATIWIDNEGNAADLEEVARLVYERWLTPDAPVTV